MALIGASDVPGWLIKTLGPAPPNGSLGECDRYPTWGDVELLVDDGKIEPVLFEQMCGGAYCGMSVDRSI